MYFSTLLNKFPEIIRKLVCFLDDISLCASKNKTRIAISISLVVIAFGCGALLLNIKTPMVIDDFSYSMAISHDKGFYATAGEIIDFQYDHYMSWGGRTIAHIIAQVLLLLSPLVADVLNSLAYVLYAFLIYYHIKAKGKHSLMLFILVNCLIWVIQPNIGDTLLWITGSANYLWCTVIILLFLLCYRLYNNGEAKQTALKTIGMFVLGVITGWTNENTVAGLIIIVLLFIPYYKTNGWRIPLWTITGFIGLIIGYVILIKAPGNINRSIVVADGFPLPLSKVLLNLIAYTKEIVKSLGALNLVGLISLILLLYNSQDKKRNRNSVFLYLIYLTGTLVSIYVMIFSPQFPPRAWFGLVTFNIISIGIIFYHLDDTFVQIRRIKQSIVLFCMLLFAAIYIEGYFDVNRINKALMEREAKIEQHIATQTPCEIKVVVNRTKFGTSDTEFLSHPLTKYYGIPIEIVH